MNQAEESGRRKRQVGGQSNAERRDGISQPEKSRMAHYAIRLFLVRLPSF